MFLSSLIQAPARALGAILVFSGAACSSAYEASPAPDLPASIVERGSLVYEGTVFPLEASDPPPAFVYQRRVDTSRRDAWVSTHVTRDTEGRIAIAESAVHSPDYELASYTLHHDQLGRSGSVSVDGERVVFTLSDAAGIETASEPRQGPVVTGPTLVGFILRHLAEIRAGAVVPVRFAVLDRKETIGFDLAMLERDGGLTRVRMKPTSFLFSLVVDPIDFTFEDSTSKLLRLEGRVPPKSTARGGLDDFDARVEYRYVAEAYR
mgnify:CR=1 FL=1